MESVVHHCQVDHIHWNYDIHSKVGGQLMLNPDWYPIYIKAVSKRNTSAATAQLRHQGRNTIATATSNVGSTFTETSRNGLIYHIGCLITLSDRNGAILDQVYPILTIILT